MIGQKVLIRFKINISVEFSSVRVHSVIPLFWIFFVSLVGCLLAAPQAVVLQLCRDRGIRGQGDSGRDRGRVESDFSLISLNHSHTFKPLEPVLDDTHLTGTHTLQVHTSQVHFSLFLTFFVKYLAECY